MADNGVAVAYRLAIINDVGQLPTRRCRRIENVFVFERRAIKPQEREYLEAVTIVVGNAEQFGI
jgi:hypothetical protein